MQACEMCGWDTRSGARLCLACRRRDDADATAVQADGSDPDGSSLLRDLLVVARDGADATADSTPVARRTLHTVRRAGTGEEPAVLREVDPDDGAVAPRNGSASRQDHAHVDGPAAGTDDTSADTGPGRQDPDTDATGDDEPGEAGDGATATTDDDTAGDRTTAADDATRGDQHDGAAGGGAATDREQVGDDGAATDDLDGAPAADVDDEEEAAADPDGDLDDEAATANPDDEAAATDLDGDPDDEAAADLDDESPTPEAAPAPATPSPAAGRADTTSAADDRTRSARLRASFVGMGGWTAIAQLALLFVGMLCVFQAVVLIVVTQFLGQVQTGTVTVEAALSAHAKITGVMLPSLAVVAMAVAVFAGSRAEHHSGRSGPHRRIAGLPATLWIMVASSTALLTMGVLDASTTVAQSQQVTMRATIVCVVLGLAAFVAPRGFVAPLPPEPDRAATADAHRSEDGTVLVPTHAGPAQSQPEPASESGAADPDRG